VGRAGYLARFLEGTPLPADLEPDVLTGVALRLPD